MQISHLPMRVALAIAAVLVFAAAAGAQDFSFFSRLDFGEGTRVDAPPKINDLKVNFPDEARKNGVEGTVKVSFVLGRDGHTHDVQIVDDLPFGTGDAVKKAVENLKFEPASLMGKPIDIKATASYKITAWYHEDDQDVKKVQVISKPSANYPEALRKDGPKGNVLVAVAFYSDGNKVEVVKSQSTMPNEFDEAAKAAAKDIKFTPAINKKSKKPVNQVIWVTFPFKP